MLSAEAIIEKYGLVPLDQEGGYFKQVWRSSKRVANEELGPTYPAGETHPMGTLIYFLLTAESFSAMHRLPTVEHWVYHLGDSVEMLLLKPDGADEMIEIGPDIESGQTIHYAVPGEYWQGARLKPGGKYGWFLGSAIMIPGFEWTDFELGMRRDLVKSYPDCEEAIRLRTRDTVFRGAK